MKHHSPQSPLPVYSRPDSLFTMNVALLNCTGSPMICTNATQVCNFAPVVQADYTNTSYRSALASCCVAAADNNSTESIPGCISNFTLQSMRTQCSAIRSCVNDTSQSPEDCQEKGLEDYYAEYCRSSGAANISTNTSQQTGKLMHPLMRRRLIGK